jgi:hypothetical protein
MGLELSITVDGAHDAELSEPDSVEVYERMGEMTVYSLRYPVAIDAGDFPLLADARLTAGSVLAVSTVSAGKPVCLVKGPVFAQRMELKHGGVDSFVFVRGADTSLAMDRENRGEVWPDVTDSDAVSSVLARYGLVADVEATAAGHFENKHALVQRETDLRFVRRLARRNGCLFWLTCDEAGVETAHFRRPRLDAEASAELVINLSGAGSEPNLEALEISWDAERPTSATAAELDMNTKDDIDGAVAASPLAPLGASALASVAPGTRSLHLSAPADDAGDLRARGEAALIEAGFFVSARCRTTRRALGSVVRAHTLVNLRGAGSRHSGKYWCAGVRHVIDADGHHMDVELLRNAWGA